jgi:hypothetical protein
MCTAIQHVGYNIYYVCVSCNAGTGIIGYLRYRGNAVL